MSRLFISGRRRRGQGLVEYIIIVAAVALICLVAVSVFGHKVADQYAIGAGMLPGAHAEDNLPIATGEYAQVAENARGNAIIAPGGASWNAITGNNGAVPNASGLNNNVLNANANDGDAFVAD